MTNWTKILPTAFIACSMTLGTSSAAKLVSAKDYALAHGMTNGAAGGKHSRPKGTPCYDGGDFSPNVGNGGWSDWCPSQNDLADDAVLPNDSHVVTLTMQQLSTLGSSPTVQLEFYSDNGAAPGGRTGGAQYNSNNGVFIGTSYGFNCYEITFAVDEDACGGADLWVGARVNNNGAPEFWAIGPNNSSDPVYFSACNQGWQFAGIPDNSMAMKLFCDSCGGGTSTTSTSTTSTNSTSTTTGGGGAPALSLFGLLALAGLVLTASVGILVYRRH